MPLTRSDMPNLLEDGLKTVFFEALDATIGDYERVALEHSRHSFEPLFGSPFLITRPFVAHMVQSVMAVKESLFSKDKSFVPLPEGMLFMNRLHFGFYSVLASLHAPADYARVEEELFRASGIAALV